MLRVADEAHQRADADCAPDRITVPICRGVFVHQTQGREARRNAVPQTSSEILAVVSGSIRTNDVFRRVEILQHAVSTDRNPVLLIELRTQRFALVAADQILELERRFFEPGHLDTRCLHHRRRWHVVDSLDHDRVDLELVDERAVVHSLSGLNRLHAPATWNSALVDVEMNRRRSTEILVSVLPIERVQSRGEVSELFVRFGREGGCEATLLSLVARRKQERMQLDEVVRCADQLLIIAPVVNIACGRRVEDALRYASNREAAMISLLWMSEINCRSTIASAALPK